MGACCEESQDTSVLRQNKSKGRTPVDKPKAGKDTPTRGKNLAKKAPSTSEVKVKVTEM